MHNIMSNISKIIKLIFGYGILFVVLAGGATFLGYVAAIIVGGDQAVIICDIIYKSIIPIIVKATSLLIVLGIVSMYLSGEVALTVKSSK